MLNTKKGKAVVITGALLLPMVPTAAFAQTAPSDPSESVLPGIGGIKDEALQVVPAAVLGAAALVAVSRGWGFIRSKVRF